MSDSSGESVLGALLDSWDRNNTILLNLLRGLPEGGLEARALEGSPSVAVQFSHIQHTRHFFLSEVVPEFLKDVAPLFQQEEGKWVPERDPALIALALEASAAAIREAVRSRCLSGLPMKGEHASYDHPVLFLQHMCWHEGYHVGQIKLALKAMGQVMSEEDEERTIWSVWRHEQW